MSDALIDPEYVRERIEMLRAADLGIAELHAMQLPLADTLEMLLALREERDRLRAALAEIADKNSDWTGTVARAALGERSGERE